MPNKYRKKIAGVLGRKPHPYHRHWRFNYSEEEEESDGHEAFLNNYDLEECPYKRQIKIVKGSVLLYIGAEDTSVTADLYLPSKVTMVIIKNFGKNEPFCFATVGAGHRKYSVYPGKELKTNPHDARRLQ